MLATAEWIRLQQRELAAWSAGAFVSRAWWPARPHSPGSVVSPQSLPRSGRRSATGSTAAATGNPTRALHQIIVTRPEHTDRPSTASSFESRRKEPPRGDPLPRALPRPQPLPTPRTLAADDGGKDRSVLTASVLEGESLLLSREFAILGLRRSGLRARQDVPVSHDHVPRGQAGRTRDAC